MAENVIDEPAYVRWFDAERQCNVGFALTTTGQGWYILGRDISQERVAWHYYNYFTGTVYDTSPLPGRRYMHVGP